jgi:FKBP-type peptidyl-prolyl cis-trans isomerase
MTLLSSLVASSARAFSHVAFRSARGSLSMTARSLSSRGGGSEPMPHSDDKMPFYALGMNLAMQVGGQSQLKTLLDDDELDVVLEAFCDTIRGNNVVEAKSVLSNYGQDLNKILAERTDKIVDRVKKDGEDYIEGFLAANDDAIKTPSGMVYCEMKKGEGKQPVLGSTVEVHYHGTLTDGTVFDSSVDRGQTLSFPLGGVIKGW